LYLIVVVFKVQYKGTATMEVGYVM